ncbi:hypothetical protein ACFYNO_08155 [Kitasatospora sp. NPDC006697]|uniref:hypothetical protein n=1 Tax=Kitasatospora sp. NPDC006697 TaxID=3364020 RepID=UPI003674605A
MAGKTIRVFGAVALLAVTGAGLAACSGAKQALDCGKTAITIAGDVQDVETTSTNVGQITDQARRKQTADALKKLGDDAAKLHTGDSGKTADDLSKAVQEAQKSLDAGRQPDLGSIKTAAGDVSKLCGAA